MARSKNTPQPTIRPAEKVSPEHDDDNTLSQPPRWARSPARTFAAAPKFPVSTTLLDRTVEVVQSKTNTKNTEAFRERPAIKRKRSHGNTVSQHASVAVSPDPTGNAVAQPLQGQITSDVSCSVSANNRQKRPSTGNRSQRWSPSSGVKTDRASEQEVSKDAIPAAAHTSDQGMKIAESVYEERVQEEQSSAVLRGGSATANGFANHVKHDHEPQPTQRKYTAPERTARLGSEEVVSSNTLPLVRVSARNRKPKPSNEAPETTKRRSKTSTGRQRTQGQQAELQGAEEAPAEGIQKDEAQAEQGQETEEQEDDEDAEEDEQQGEADIVDFEVTPWQQTPHGIAYRIEPHPHANWDTLKRVEQVDISEYAGDLSTVRKGHMLNVLYENGPPTGAPAKVIEIRIRGKLKHIHVVIQWLWSQKEIDRCHPCKETQTQTQTQTKRRIKTKAETNDSIQERLRPRKRWVLSNDFRAITPENIVGRAEVDENGIAGDVYFDTTAKERAKALPPMEALETSGAARAQTGTSLSSATPGDNNQREPNCVRISTQTRRDENEPADDTFARYLPTSAANRHIRDALRKIDATKEAQMAGVGTTKTGYVIRFKDRTSTETAKAHTEWLKELGNGTKLVKPRFGVVVHRLPTEGIQLPENAKQVIERMMEENDLKAKGHNIEDIAWLKRTDQTPGTSASMGMWFDTLEAADYMISNGLVHGQRYIGSAGPSVTMPNIPNRQMIITYD